MRTERQEQILKTSIELIANKGIQGFTIKNLSHAIGISEPAIYRHFESKTAILLAILDNFKEMAGMMSSSITNSENRTIDKIEILFLNLIEMFIKQPTIISVIFSEEIFKNDIQLKNKIIEIHNLNQTNIERIIDEGLVKGYVRNDLDTSSLALIFMGAFRLLVKRWDLNGYNFNLKSEGEKLIHSFKLLL